jgi:cysteine-S-conjugate beta-lyase
MLSTGFELPVDVLRQRSNVKWRKYGPDSLPAWVAEMDFSVAHPIQRTLERMVADQDYGYPDRGGHHGEGTLVAAFGQRMQSRFGWTVDPELCQPLGDLVQGTFSTILALSEPGDGVILQLPAYPPFHEAINSTGRRLIPYRLHSDAASWRHEPGALEKLVDPTTRILLLCNPQNPTGRVFDHAELAEIGRVAVERDLIILSDEIHADLVYPGQTHTPIATISPEVAARTITITSATKGFNIPGLRCGVMHFGSQALKERFHARFPARVLGTPGVMGIDATVAAWTHGQPWLDAVLERLDANRRRIAAFLAEQIPAIRAHMPEATYLGWLDCSRLGLPGSAFGFFQDRARVSFSAGETFDPEHGRDFVRFNFATSGTILEHILGRMEDAVRSNAR